MTLELAALAGYAPDDQMRAADLLVIQGAYASTAEASAALARMTRDPKRREGKRLPRGTRMNMIKRMAYMLGVVGPGDEENPKSRLRSALGWVGVGVVVLVGLVLPLVWVPYMAWAFRKSGLQMGARASAFYAERRSEEAGVTVRRKAPTVRIAMSAGFARMGLLVAVPVVVAVIALLAGADIGTGKWLSAVIFLLIVSGLVTLAWFGYRWWRRRRLLGPEPAAA
jgi:hypothetical protein